MSNINNNGVDMNNNTLTQLNLSAVKELDDEVAATCSGGVGRKGGNDPDIIFFTERPSGGDLITTKINASIGDGDPNIGLDNEGRDNGINDQRGKISIIRGRWILFQDSGFKGAAGPILTPGVWPVDYGITSALRVG